MDDLAWDFKRMCDRDPCSEGRGYRKSVLMLAAKELKQMGFRHLRAKSIKQKHINALVVAWCDQGLTTGAIKSRKASLRWALNIVGRVNVIN